MRMKTPVNQETLKNHLTYNSWKYLILAVGVFMGWSLIYTTTAYRSPQNKRIDLYVQSATASTDLMNVFLEPIWKETAPEMETVNAVVLTPADDYTTSMQMMAYMAAGDADIYFLNEQSFKTYAAQGAFLPLEDLISDGSITVSEDVDLSKGYITYVEKYDDNDLPIATSRHLYGIPLDTYYGLMYGMQLDNRNMFAVITVNNMNDENVIPFFNAVLQAGQGEKEDWITDQE